MILPYLFVAPSSKGGRGVFADQDIPSGTVIEISPVLVLNSTERKCVEETKLYNYIFEWGKRRKMGALGLGYISLYNHDYEANCEYEMDYDDNLISVRTIRPIKQGDELCINYNANPSDKSPVWFHEKYKS